MSTTQPTPEATPASITVTKELEAKLIEYESLAPLVARYEKLKKELKPVFEGTPEFSVGDFDVTGGWVTMPARQMAECTYWNMRVKRKPRLTLQPNPEAAPHVAAV